MDTIKDKRRPGFDRDGWAFYELHGVGGDIRSWESAISYTYKAKSLPDFTATGFTMSTIDYVRDELDVRYEPRTEYFDFPANIQESALIKTAREQNKNWDHGKADFIFLYGVYMEKPVFICANLVEPGLLFGVKQSDNKADDSFAGEFLDALETFYGWGMDPWLKKWAEQAPGRV